MNTLKAEFRKLLTVRATYILTILSVLFVAVISFWPQGLLLKPAQLHDPTQIAGDITGPLVLFAILGGMVGILLLTNEYRYNTIMYSLTSTNRRLKVLAAKFVVASLFGLFFVTLIAAVSPLCSLLGIHLAGHHLAPQIIQYHSIIWRGLYAGWGMSAIGLLLAVLIRNQIGAIMAMFIIPLIAESLLLPVLHDRTDYLPFHSLITVIQPDNYMSPGRAALIFLCYIVVGWIIGVTLFLKRDAN